MDAYYKIRTVTSVEFNIERNLALKNERSVQLSIACSRLSDNGVSEKLELAKKNEWGLGMKGQALGRGRRKETCETFFTDSLPPTFVHLSIY